MLLFKVIVPFLLLLLKSLHVTSQQNLDMCSLYGDPHIREFQRNNQGYRSWKDCYNANILNAVDNQYVTLRIDVNSVHLIVRLNFEFRTSLLAPFFCTISSTNFNIFMLGNCSGGGVNANIIDNRYMLVISVSYPQAEVFFVVTHYKWWSWRHFNIEIWMPPNVSATDQGVCRVPGCVGSSSGRKRSLQNYVNNATNISNQTAARICNTYIDAYLTALPRLPSQRDAHYNSTIDMVRETCVFDVTTIGAEMAISALQVLMVEEKTTGVTNLTDLSVAFQNNLQTTIETMIQVVNNTLPRIAGILNDTTTTQSTQITTLSSTAVVTNLITNSSMANPVSTTTHRSATTASESAANSFEIHSILFFLMIIKLMQLLV